MKLTFTSTAGSVTFGREGSYLLLAVTGTGGPRAEVQLQRAPYQDGGTFVDALLEPRELEVEAAVLAPTPEVLDSRRAILSRIFNPKLGPGTLRVDMEGFSREIEAVSEQAPVFPTGPQNQGRTFQRVLLRLLCPDPWWPGPQERYAWLVGSEGGLRFPVRFPISFAKLASEVALVNEGDAPCPVVIEFYGPASRPRVDNLTTGQFIEVLQDLAAGQVLVINTTFGQKSVTVLPEGTNAMAWINLESEFWSLVPGTNKVRYSALSGGENAKVAVRWRPRFVGV